MTTAGPICRFCLANPGWAYRPPVPLSPPRPAMLSLDFLMTSAPLTSVDLDEAEQRAFAGETLEHRLAQRLIREVRRLGHELADPSYMFATDRIRRDAILCRNAEIDELRARLSPHKAK